MELIERLGVDVSPGDVVGLSTQIMYGSGQAEMKRQVDLQHRFVCPDLLWDHNLFLSNTYIHSRKIKHVTSRNIQYMY